MKKLEFRGYRISQTQMLIKQNGDLPIYILVDLGNDNYHAWLDYVLGCLNKGNESFVKPEVIGSKDYHVYTDVTDLTKESGG